MLTNSKYDVSKKLIISIIITAAAVICTSAFSKTIKRNRKMDVCSNLKFATELL